MTSGQRPTAEQRAVHRARVGIAACLCLTVAAGLYLFAPPGSGATQMMAGSLRIGVVLAALWLALPDLDRWSNQLLLVGMLVLAIIGALWPKLFVFAAVFLVVLAFLQSRVFGGRRLPPRASPTTRRDVPRR